MRIFNVCINDFGYVLINLYNANTEKEEINVLAKLF